MGNSILSRLDDTFKPVFRILIVSLDQLVCLEKNMSKLLCRACVKQKQIITLSNYLNIKSYFYSYQSTTMNRYIYLIYGIQ